MRDSIKLAFFATCVAIMSPAILLCQIERLLGKRDLLFGPFIQIAALLPGLPGTYLRTAFYVGTLSSCSWKVHLGFGSMIVNWQARLEEHVTVGSYCILGHVQIGRNTRLASRVSIPSGKRQHIDDQGRISSGSRFDTVTIGENCWIGEGAIVMANVARNSIVSAGAVVTKDVPEFSIVGGNPARTIGRVTPDKTSSERID